MRIVVLGVGNILLTDEGVGVRTIERLLAEYDFPPEVVVLDGGTASMEMLEDLENLDGLIVVDAVFANQAVGEVVKLVDDEVPAFFRRRLSPHQIGLSDVLASLELVEREPKKMIVIGVKPVSIELGLELTPTVSARVPQLMEMVLESLSGWGIEVRRKES
jgi:hydrogenase maturation protease